MNEPFPYPEEDTSPEAQIKRSLFEQIEKKITGIVLRHPEAEYDAEQDIRRAVIEDPESFIENVFLIGGEQYAGKWKNRTFFEQTLFAKESDEEPDVISYKSYDLNADGTIFYEHSSGDRWEDEHDGEPLDKAEDLDINERRELLALISGIENRL